MRTSETTLAVSSHTSTHIRYTSSNHLHISQNIDWYMACNPRELGQDASGNDLWQAGRLEPSQRDGLGLYTTFQGFDRRALLVSSALTALLLLVCYVILLRAYTRKPCYTGSGEKDQCNPVSKISSSNRSALRRPPRTLQNRSIYLIKGLKVRSLPVKDSSM